MKKKKFWWKRWKQIYLKKAFLAAISFDIVNIPLHFFFTKFLSYLPQWLIILFPFEHWRQTSIGWAYPPIVPIDDKVSPYQGFKFLDCHLLCIISAIQEFFLHPCPHGFTACIVMTSSAIAVHSKSLQTHLTIFLWDNRRKGNYLCYRYTCFQ